MREICGQLEDFTDSQRLAMAVVSSLFIETRAATRLAKRLQTAQFIKTQSHEHIRRRYHDLRDDMSFVASQGLDHWLSPCPR